MDEFVQLRNNDTDNSNKPLSITNFHLEQLEETLDKLHQDFEYEVELYEQNYEKLRRMKSHLLAVDFTETFLREEDDNDDEEENNTTSSNNLPSNTKGLAGNPPTPKNPAPNSRIPSELEVISEKKSNDINKSTATTHPPLKQASSTHAYDKMHGMWDKIRTLEELLETHRTGLREKIENILRKEKELKHISLYLNTTRKKDSGPGALTDPSRSSDRDRSSNTFHMLALQKSHELNLLLPLHNETEAEATPTSPGIKFQARGGGGEKNKLLDPESGGEQGGGLRRGKAEESELLLSTESRSGNLLSSGKEQGVMSPLPTDSFHVEDGNEAASNPDLQITRGGWMFCIGVNVFVVLATVGILVANSLMPHSH